MIEAQGYEAVGWVFGEPVTHEMLTTYLAHHTPPAAVGDSAAASSRWAVRAVMTAMLARQEAARRGLTTESDLPAVVADELVGDGAPPEADVLAYFERNRQRYERPEHRRVRHVLCETEKEAGSVAGKARSGQPLSVLAGQYSVDAGSRGAGGDLGPLKRGELAGEIEELAFGAQEGQVIGPVRSPFGWHVLVVESIEPGGVADLASVQEDIAAELAERRRREAYVAWLERRALDGITMAPDYEHPFRPSFLEWAHRH
jgi:parvulin-like peptidyl-prolyl isomerase